jgi:zinc protease
VERRGEDFAAVQAMNFALGGSGFSSRYMKQIRKEKGYAYDVRSLFSAGYGLPGYFRTRIETGLESAPEALGLMLDILREIHEDGVTGEELDMAKAYFEGSLPRRTETYGQIAAHLTVSVLFDLPMDYWIREARAIRDLDLDRVNRAARDHLHPNDFVMVIVADTSKLLIEDLGVDFETVEVLEIQ